MHDSGACSKGEPLDAVSRQAYSNVNDVNEPEIQGVDMIKKQFTLYLQNRPGVLADVTRRLADKSINIEGISAAAGTDVALVQIVVSNAAKARQMLKQAHIAFTVQDVVVYSLENTPGALAKAAARVAKAGININYIYGTACACQGKSKSYVVLSGPDLKRLEALLV